MRNSETLSTPFLFGQVFLFFQNQEGFQLVNDCNKIQIYAKRKNTISSEVRKAFHKIQRPHDFWESFQQLKQKCVYIATLFRGQYHHFNYVTRVQTAGDERLPLLLCFSSLRELQKLLCEITRKHFASMFHHKGLDVTILPYLSNITTLVIFS